ncbi:MAG TPA: hypothetical protein VH678_23545 [Xanthobacteraceae bacterium]
MTTRARAQQSAIDELFAIDRLIHGIEVTLERGLLGGMVKALITEPDLMTSLPSGSNISPVVAQEKALNASRCLSDRFDSDLRGPDQIAHRLVGLVGNPYGGKFASAREPRQQNRIASVSLDAIASCRAT